MRDLGAQPTISYFPIGFFSLFISFRDSFPAFDTEHWVFPVHWVCIVLSSVRNVLKKRRQRTILIPMHTAQRSTSFKIAWFVHKIQRQFLSMIPCNRWICDSFSCSNFITSLSISCCVYTRQELQTRHQTRLS